MNHDVDIVEMGHCCFKALALLSMLLDINCNLICFFIRKLEKSLTRNSSPSLARDVVNTAAWL